MAGIRPAGGAGTQRARNIGRDAPTGSTADWPEVPQGGAKAEQVKKNLAKIKLPPGFKIYLYAVVPDARHIAVGPQGVVTFVGTRKDEGLGGHRSQRGWRRRRGEGVRPDPSNEDSQRGMFLEGRLPLHRRAEPCAGVPAAEFFYESPDVAVGDVVAEGELIPKAEESYNHTARVCRIGPDKKLYIQLGQPYNVPPRRRSTCTASSASAASSAWTATARTARSTPRHAQPGRHGLQPEGHGELWTNDNQVDGMGDEHSAGEN